MRLQLIALNNASKEKLSDTSSSSSLLFSASCVLLGINSTQAQEAESIAENSQREQWEIDAGVLVFSEFERVFGTAASLSGRTYFDDEGYLQLTGIIDVLAGASANGAVPTDIPQTFSRPSGSNDFVVDAGDVPLDEFQDTRLGFSAELGVSHADHHESAYALALSHEFDYQSVGISSIQSFDINQKNTRLRAGFSASHDRVHPVGGIPKARTQMLATDASRSTRSAAKTKNVFGLLAGVDQVIDQYTALQISYSLTYSEGYHTDPYKLISIVGGSGAPIRHIYEHRPDSQQSNAVAVTLKRAFDMDALHVSLRFTQDDWDVSSQTLELRYRLQNQDGTYWQPRVRWYRQTEANFYRRYHLDSEPLPENLSADRRLGEFSAVTLGVKYGKDQPNNSYGFIIEYYLQEGDNNPDDAVGVLREFDLYPSVESLILQLNYAFLW